MPEITAKFKQGEVVRIETTAIYPSRKDSDCRTFGEVSAVIDDYSYFVKFSHYVNGKQRTETWEFLADELRKENPNT